MTKRLAIFDIDGTLHKTEIMSLEAYKNIMPKLGLPIPDKNKIFSTYGCNSEELIDLLNINTSEKERFIKALEEEEVIQMYRVSECYHGITDLLKKLTDMGIIIGVCSMCKPPYMDAFLKRFDFEKIVEYRRNESDGTDKAEILRQLLDESSPDEVVMIGDRVFDIDAARQNGIASIGCMYGYAPDEVETADILAKDTKELYVAVCKLLNISL